MSAPTSLRDLQEVAAHNGLTVSDWVRQMLRAARREQTTGNQARKLAAVRAATRHQSFDADFDRYPGLERVS